LNIQQWHYDVLAQRTVEALKKNEFDAVYFSNRKEAVDYVLNFISENNDVGFGGSMTVKELGIAEKAAEKGAKILNHGSPDLTQEQKIEVMRKQLVSDVFLCSANAVTLNGCIVNVDGVGNRVASTIFGPKKVILVVGANKIVEDEEMALERIRNVSGPQNSKRLNLSNPCTVTGICDDCDSKTRICRVYTVMAKKPRVSNIEVVIIGENLGY
jgi:hypothetical protein